MNVIATPQLLTKLTLANLGGMLSVCKNMSNDYTSEFGNQTRKIGDTFLVRKPQRFQVTDGLLYQPQPIANTQTPITVDQVAGVHFEFDVVEKTLSLDYINEKYAKPAAIAMANEINARAAKFIALNTFNNVGTPGTVPTAMLTYLGAGSKLIEQGLPKNAEKDLTMIINRKMSDAYVDASKTFFNKAELISKQQTSGQVANTLGYNWELDQTLYTHTYGSYAGTILVNGANQQQEGGNNGTGTIVTDGHTSGTSTVKAGDKFTLGINSVHPQTRQDTGSLQQFVALTTQLDVTGAMTIVMSPAITPSGQYQNVTAAPADNAAVTFAGAASSVSTQGLLLHPDAFAFMSVPMDDPKPGMGAIASSQVDPQTGLRLSFIQFYDGVHRVEGSRFDALFGFGPLYRELACVVNS